MAIILVYVGMLLFRLEHYIITTIVVYPVHWLIIPFLERNKNKGKKGKI